MSRPSDRRAIMAGLAGCITAGAVGAAAGGGSARAAAARAETSAEDGRILKLAAEFERLERQRLDLFPGSGSNGAIFDDDNRDAAIEPLDIEQERIVAELATLRASSVAALGAVASALMLWDGDQFPDPADGGEFTNHRLAAWIAQNAVAMARRSA